ncbi:MAG: hypothetical protein AVDCRST_MAG90-524, partial [uncultured Microvirga sp.]
GARLPPGPPARHLRHPEHEGRGGHGLDPRLLRRDGRAARGRVHGPRRLQHALPPLGPRHARDAYRDELGGAL